MGNTGSTSRYGTMPVARSPVVVGPYGGGGYGHGGYGGVGYGGDGYGGYGYDGARHGSICYDAPGSIWDDRNSPWDFGVGRSTRRFRYMPSVFSDFRRGERTTRRGRHGTRRTIRDGRRDADPLSFHVTDGRGGRPAAGEHREDERRAACDKKASRGERRPRRGQALSQVMIPGGVRAVDGERVAGGEIAPAGERVPAAEKAPKGRVAGNGRTPGGARVFRGGRALDGGRAAGGQRAAAGSERAEQGLRSGFRSRW